MLLMVAWAREAVARASAAPVATRLATDGILGTRQAMGCSADDKECYEWRRTNERTCGCDESLAACEGALFKRKAGRCFGKPVPET